MPPSTLTSYTDGSRSLPLAYVVPIVSALQLSPAKAAELFGALTGADALGLGVYVQPKGHGADAVLDETMDVVAAASHALQAARGSKREVLRAALHDVIREAVEAEATLGGEA